MSRRSGLGLLGAALLAAAAGSARAVVYPSIAGMDYQTSARERVPGIGDWYTTRTSASTDRMHRFVVEITPAQLAGAGGTVLLTVQDAESRTPNGAGGPVDEVANTTDPTRFQLRDRTGTVVLQTATFPTGSPTGSTAGFTIAAAGVYQITTVTGAFPISGGTGAATNDDDNGWRIDVPGAGGATGGLVGYLQSTVTHNNVAPLDYTTYVLVGPGTPSLALRNFDVDACAGCAVTYTRPSGAALAGTVSGNGVWNNGGTLDVGQDLVGGLATLGPGVNDAGIWRVSLSSLNATNQVLFEARNGGTGERLPVYDQLPLRAGSFTIAANGTLSTVIGTPVDHPFTVTNLFTTSDLVNLTLSGTSANWTVELRTSGGAPLADLDGDGNLDTGILAPGASIALVLRVTPNAGASGPDVTRVSGVSYMDTKVVPGTNTTLFVDKTTRLKPEIGKEFSPASIGTSGSSTLTFTLTNPNTAPALSGAQFTDTYPAGVVNRAPLTVGGTCTGVAYTAAAGGGSFAVTAADIPAGGACTITVEVTSAVPGSYANTASGVATTETGAAGNPSPPATLVVQPPMVVAKTSQTLSDPVNGGTNPKAIPGAQVAYRVQLTNSGGAPFDAGTVVVTDAVPANADLYVGDVSGPGSGPIAFVDGAPASGLTYSFVALGDPSDGVEFSNDGGATYAYTPVPDGAGVDATVTHLRIRPQGSMGAARSCEIRFRVHIE